MKNYYYFYDLNEILIDRYPSKIANTISSKNRSSNFVFIYSERYKSTIPSNIPNGSKYFFISDLSSRKLDEIIERYPPNSLTTIAQRIPDMWMLTYFNHKNIPTFIVQHGLWSDHLERLPLFFLLLGKFKKFMNYLRYTYFLCKKNKIPFMQTLIDLYRFLLKEDTFIPQTKNLDNEKLRANIAFIFDESWDDYYIKKYGYSKKQLNYIGNPDFLLLKGKDLDNKEDAICYICQSFVEDGRLARSNFANFTAILKKHAAIYKKLYIKLHPRSNMKYYSNLQDNPNIEFTNELPICKYYIGHYSGLLATVKQISDEILIWKLNNHHTPTYFLQYGSVITYDTNTLSEFAKGNIPYTKINLLEKRTKKEFELFNPIRTISNNIIKYSIQS